MEVIENKRLVYEFGKFTLDPNERMLYVDGTAVHLPAKEFDTLLLLIEHNGRALTKEEMMSAIWQDAFVEQGNLAKQISRLRKVLNGNGDAVIETIPKHGYKLKVTDLRIREPEPLEPVIVEKRTIRRVKIAARGDDVELRRGSLGPPSRDLRYVGVPFVLILLVSTVFLAWYFYPRNSPSVDPYEPVRLTDNPNDDTGPIWTRDGRIRFSRVFPDNRSVKMVMSSDGKDQAEIQMPEGKMVLGWSPDEQKIMYRKGGDLAKTYISNIDGSGEALLPFRGGTWSADSKMIVSHHRVSADNVEIFTYNTETGDIKNITNNESFDADPSFSPDGERILFTSTRDGSGEIYSISLDGSDLRRLTMDPAIDSHAAYSPDGTQILFTSTRQNENADVYLMNADGSGVVNLTRWDKSNETAGPGGWSPDGTKIAFFSDKDGRDDIYVMSAETVRPKQLLTDADGDIEMFDISRDGKEIAYSLELAGKNGELKICDLESGGKRLVTKSELGAVGPEWSPDGSLIAFHDRVGGNSEIHVIKPDGTDLRNLTNNPALDVGPSWSPDGQKILFLTGRDPPSDMPQIYSMSSDGSDARPITARKGWEGDPRWTPDGNSIVFACDRTDSPGDMMDICEIGADGTRERRLLFHRDYDFAPSLSPGGDRIAFTARSDGNLEIYVMNRDGSGLLRLTRHAADDTRPKWSPDGSYLAFVSNREGRSAVYKIEV